MPFAVVDMMGTPGFPCVLKVSHAHAGYGKVKVPNHHDFDDLRGLIALHKYVFQLPTAESNADLIAKGGLLHL